MTTATQTQPETRTQTGGGNRDNYCPGCPRCQNPDALLCSQHHEKWGGLHPRCKVCRCCVLRGRHLDPAEDLDTMEGPGRHVGLGPISNN